MGPLVLWSFWCAASGIQRITISPASTCQNQRMDIVFLCCNAWMSFVIIGFSITVALLLVLIVFSLLRQFCIFSFRL